jgi:AGZA family xanthine/uracil permease-like MFS transporter
VPRAALLGSIAGVAILMIAFLPALKVFRDPVVGLVALTVLCLALFGGVRMPFGMPGALAAVAAGAGIFWLRAGLGGAPPAHALPVAGLGLALPWPSLAWIEALPAALPYLSIALPFALVTVIGGIDNTESAAAAGDEYRTRDILMTEALATIAAGVAGGVVQNTPYIGHPAYKAMGARAGYTLATGLVIGVGAALGALSALMTVLPEAAVAPILIFIGLEITAQAFQASPARHGPAVALAFLPVAAAVVLIVGGNLLGALGKTPADLSGNAGATWAALVVLSPRCYGRGPWSPCSSARRGSRAPSWPPPAWPRSAASSTRRCQMGRYSGPGQRPTPSAPTSPAPTAWLPRFVGWQSGGAPDKIKVFRAPIVKTLHTLSKQRRASAP